MWLHTEREKREGSKTKKISNNLIMTQKGNKRLSTTLELLASDASLLPVSSIKTFLKKDPKRLEREIAGGGIFGAAASRQSRRRENRESRKLETCTLGIATSKPHSVAIREQVPTLIPIFRSGFSSSSSCTVPPLLRSASQPTSYKSPSAPAHSTSHVHLHVNYA